MNVSTVSDAGGTGIIRSHTAVSGDGCPLMPRVARPGPTSLRLSTRGSLPKDYAQASLDGSRRSRQRREALRRSRSSLNTAGLPVNATRPSCVGLPQPVGGLPSSPSWPPTCSYQVSPICRKRMPQWVYRSTTTAPGGLVGAGAGVSRRAGAIDVRCGACHRRHQAPDRPHRFTLAKYAMSSTIADTELAGSLLLLTRNGFVTSSSVRPDHRVTGSVPRLPGASGSPLQRATRRRLAKEGSRDDPDDDSLLA